MTRSIHRRSLFARALSTYVVLVVLISFAGVGYAAPGGSEMKAGKASGETTATPTEIGEVTQEADGPSGDAVAPDPVPAPEGGTEAEPTLDVEPTIEGQPLEAPSPTEPAVAAAIVRAPAPAVVEASVIETTAAGAKLTLEGFNRNGENPGWTTGNLKEYEEGQWVAHRVVIDNTGNKTKWYSMPLTSVLYDHYWDNSDAIFYDKTRNWGISSTPGAPTDSDEGIPAGNTGFAKTEWDEPTSGTWGVDAPQLRTTWAANVIMVPPGEYGVIYWQAHLAISAYWKQQTDNWGAGPWSPGSPSHTWLYATGEGAKKVPIPSVDLPGGSIAGLKFNDLANRGTYDAGEPGLGDWVFHLNGGPEGYTPLNLVSVSSTAPATLGQFSFSYLPPGTYHLTEESKADWSSAYSFPIEIVITDGESVAVKVGNYHTDVHKTFELTIGTAPMGTTFFARYWINGNTTPEADVPLSGAGTKSGGVTLPYGTVIDKVEWYASYDGKTYLLGTQTPNETLTDAENLNEFEYSTYVSGRKWNDLDEDGVKDTSESWLSGWLIELRRASDDSVYAVDETDVNGRYEFVDVLPGSYYVREQLKTGWFQTHAPAGSFAVADGFSDDDLDFGNVQVLSAIDVSKSGESTARIGDTITYEITVTNTGMTTLTSVVVSDPMFGTLGTIPVFAPGASQTYHPQHTVTASDPDPLDNTVTAMGIDLLGQTKTDVAEWRVDIVHPDFTLIKTVAPQILVFEGDVLYTYRVENTGDVPLYGLTLEDDQLGSITVADPTLDVGEVATFTAPAHLTADTTNVATATAYDSWEDPYERVDDAFVDVRNPAISIVKSATPPMIHEGDDVTYTYLITNTGDTTLTDITLVDNVLADLTYLLPTRTLAPGASMTTQITVPVDDDVTNIGTTVGTYGSRDTEFFGTVTDWSDATVDVIFPGIEVRKVADPTVILAGETVTYSYEVENTGDSTLTATTLYDDQLGWITLSDTELSPGEIVTGSKSAAVSEDTTNVATAEGVDPLGASHEDSATAFVDVIDPDVEIDKTVSPGMVAFEGWVYYDFEVTNDGDVTLYDVEVNDDVMGYIGTIPELAPGQSYTFEDVPWFVTDDTHNIGTATGSDDYGHSVEDTDTADVDVFDPDVEITKLVDPETVLAGEEVTYTYIVENTGDYPFWGLWVDDDILGPVGTHGPMAPGDTWTFTATSEIDDDTLNVATVEAWYGYESIVDNEPAMADDFVTDSDDAFVDVIHPAIDVVKSADKTFVIEPGEDVVYTYVVTNVGDVPLYGMVLADDVLGAIGGAGLMNVGESMTFSTTAFVDADTLNTALATASDALGNEVSDTDTWEVIYEPLLPFPPDLSIEKVANKELAKPGETVTYTLLYKNLDTAPKAIAENFTITDDFDGRYMTVVDAAGGTVSGSTISWFIPGPLGPQETGTISYQLKVASDMPTGTTNVDNVVVLDYPDDPDKSNNRDEERVRVPVEGEEPFLPFTGGDAGLLLGAIALTAIFGGVLRRKGHRVA